MNQAPPRAAASRPPLWRRSVLGWAGRAVARVHGRPALGDGLSDPSVARRRSVRGLATEGSTDDVAAVAWRAARPVVGRRRRVWSRRNAAVSEGGFALIAVLWLLVALSAIGVQAALETRTERLAAANLLDQTRSREVAMAGARAPTFM